MSYNWLHFPPSFLFLFGAFMIFFLPLRLRRIFILIIPTLSLLQIYTLDQGSYAITYDFLEVYTLMLLDVSPLRICFAYVFVIMCFIASLYSIHVKNAPLNISAFLYVGGALGVVFAGDYLTLFIYWELMAVSSAAIILLRKNKASKEAGYRYLLVHIVGGALLMTGILFQYFETSTLLIDKPIRGSFAYIFILLGFCINAAVPPLSAWLSDAYPEASVTGSVFLTAYTTKTAVFVLALIFAGESILIWAGVFMALYGVIYAILENDIRRLLAYSIISQVGYMVCGVGLGTALAINGTGAHAFSHILYKALLFMAAGAVIMATGRRQMTELGGLHKKMPWVFLFYMVAGFAISGFPLLNGFISKSMIISAAGQQHLPMVETLLKLAAVGTFFSTTLKLPYYTFFSEDKNIEVRSVPGNMMVAMALGAFLCILHGIFPGLLYSLLPYAVEYHPFTLDHIVSALQMLTATLIIFLILKKHFGGNYAYTRDTDLIFKFVVRWVSRLSHIGIDRGGEIKQNFYRPLIHKFTRILLRFTPHLREGRAYMVESIGISIAFTIFFTTIIIVLSSF